MQCHEINNLLTAYLDDEISPAERTLLQAHLAECEICRQKLAALSVSRKRLNNFLKFRAENTAPSPQAWNHLQAMILKEVRTPSIQTSQWIPRQAPEIIHKLLDNIQGVKYMQKKYTLTAITAFTGLLIAAILIIRNVTPVSAQQILDRAYAAQTASENIEGIHHILIETFNNPYLSQQEHQGTTTVMESYLDFKSGNFRTTITDKDSGKINDVFAYDGSHTYTIKPRLPDEPDSSTIIYRTPQDKDKLGKQIYGDPSASARWYFDEMRKDSAVKVEKEYDTAGSQVYVLRSDHSLVKVLAGDQTQIIDGSITMVFESETYELLESKTTTKKDGDEILVNSYKYLANEILPAGSEVAWDLSDLKDVTFIDDADAAFGDLMPQVITRAELAANTTSGYVLNNIPEGFEEEITAAPRQNEETYSYVATYRSETGGLIVLQSAGEIAESLIESEFNEESYQTAAGFVLYLGKSTDVDDRNKMTQAVVKAPDGFYLFLNASLPPDQLKLLAEELVAAQ